MLIYIIFIFEALSFFASLIIYRRQKVPLYLRFFPIFLLVTVIQDVVGFSIKGEIDYYFLMVNAYSVFEFSFYGFVLYQLIQAGRVKTIILYSIVLYAVAILAYCMVVGNTFSGFVYMLGATLTVCFCIYYFYEIFKFPVYKNPAQEPTFWICLGLLVFKSCTIPILGMFNYIGASFTGNQVVSIILSISNYFLYTAFVVSFICFLKSRSSNNVVIN